MSEKGKNTVVIYYSNKGSNKYLAEKVSHELKCEIEEIKPKCNSFGLLLLFSKLNMGMGIKKIKANLLKYEKVILCGPVWMGSFIYPLRTFLKKYQNKITILHFVTCCGSNDKMKDDRFGYNNVFKEVQNDYGDMIKTCTAFPIPLLLTEDEQKDDQKVMSTRLSNNTVNAFFEQRFENFMVKLKSVEN